MNATTFSMSDLMTLLTQAVGLPPSDQTGDPSAGFADIGLDSLAFLELQTALEAKYGIDLGDDGPQHYTFGRILDIINARLCESDSAQAS